MCTSLFVGLYRINIFLPIFSHSYMAQVALCACRSFISFYFVYIHLFQFQIFILCTHTLRIYILLCCFFSSSCLMFIVKSIPQRSAKFYTVNTLPSVRYIASTSLGCLLFVVLFLFQYFSTNMADSLTNPTNLLLFKNRIHRLNTLSFYVMEKWAT